MALLIAIVKLSIISERFCRFRSLSPTLFDFQNYSFEDTLEQNLVEDEGLNPQHIFSSVQDVIKNESN